MALAKVLAVRAGGPEFESSATLENLGTVAHICDLSTRGRVWRQEDLPELAELVIPRFSEKPCLK